MLIAGLCFVGLTLAFIATGLFLVTKTREPELGAIVLCFPTLMMAIIAAMFLGSI